MKNKCPRCGGTGIIEDAVKVGAAMRLKRVAAVRSGQGHTLRAVATKMGFTASYICDLEKGRRPWSDALKKAYLKALDV